MLRKMRVPGLIVEMMVLVSGSSMGTGRLFFAQQEEICLPQNIGITAEGLIEHPVWPWEVPFLHGVFS